MTVHDVSANEQQWSGVLPTGESWSAKITRVYDRMDIRYSIDGNLVESSFGESTDQATGSGQVTCCNPMAITKNPKAAALRVLRSNGDRYTIPLHELPGTDGVRLGRIRSCLDMLHLRRSLPPYSCLQRGSYAAL